ncbi:MAG TPA: AbrB/MazE/SpoVT family DNA-binding domain-containing protein [Thermoanaerobaculia bacterium]|nr:AbrB/MazE/SpoVT family DNA-binding domain-containing protein [Thermoanaerobaculia bacterium]
MKARVQKWGNSLALRIPKPFAEEARLTDGSAVEMTLRNGKIILTRVRPPALTLETLLEGITTDNRHAETDLGGRFGDEEW